MLGAIEQKWEKSATEDYKGKMQMASHVVPIDPSTRGRM